MREPNKKRADLILDKRKKEREFVRKIKKRIKELTIQRNKVVVNSKSRQRYNFAIGELMFLMQE